MTGTKTTLFNVTVGVHLRLEPTVRYQDGKVVLSFVSWGLVVGPFIPSLPSRRDRRTFTTLVFFHVDSVVGTPSVRSGLSPRRIHVTRICVLPTSSERCLRRPSSSNFEYSCRQGRTHVPAPGTVNSGPDGRRERQGSNRVTRLSTSGVSRESRS